MTMQGCANRCKAMTRMVTMLIAGLMAAALSTVVGCAIEQPDLREPTVRRVVGKPQPQRPVQVPQVQIPSPAPNRVPASWIPPSQLESKRRWEGIVIHHSAGDFGDAAAFDREHKKRGWDGLGYHFVINNGHNRHRKADGLVEVGRRWRKQGTGAHCRPKGNRSNYWNEHTVGICLVGNFDKARPTAQQWQSLLRLVRFLQRRYGIRANQIKGHGEIMATACPGRFFPMAQLRQTVAQ